MPSVMLETLALGFPPDLVKGPNVGSGLSSGGRHAMVAQRVRNWATHPTNVGSMLFS